MCFFVIKGLCFPFGKQLENLLLFIWRTVRKHNFVIKENSGKHHILKLFSPVLVKCWKTEKLFFSSCPFEN